MSHFIMLNQLPATEAVKDGFLSMVQTEQLTIAYTNLKAGVEIPLHQHQEEAVDILLEGILEMQVGDKSNTITQGMIVIVPPGLPHSARAITQSKVVTVYYPKRSLSIS
jgi:quercetin dioxygenase-like cupin family protein